MILDLFGLFIFLVISVVCSLFLVFIDWFWIKPDIMLIVFFPGLKVKSP